MLDRRKYKHIFLVREFSQADLEAHLKAIKNLEYALRILGVETFIYSFEVSPIWNFSYTSSNLKLVNALNVLSPEEYLRSSRVIHGILALMSDVYGIYRELRNFIKDTTIINIVNVFRGISLMLKSVNPRNLIIIHIYGFIDINPTITILKDFFEGVIVTSQRLLNVIKSITRNNVLHIYPPIDIGFFTSCDQNRVKRNKEDLIKYFMNTNKLILTYIGNVNEVRFPQKIIETLHEVASMNKIEFILNVLTPPTQSNRKYLEQLKMISSKYHTNGVTINFYDRFLTLNEKIELLVGSHFFLFPARSHEVLSYVIDPPMAVEEAIACGTPILSTLEFDLIKRFRTGIISTNYEALMHKAIKIIENENSYIQFVENALSIAHKFNPINNALKYLEFIGKIDNRG